MLSFVLGTIVGTFLGAFFGHIVPRVLTAKSRATRASRHILWAWEDFGVLVDRQVRKMKEDLNCRKEDLASRGVLKSGEALTSRASTHRLYREVVEDKWRDSSRRVDEIGAELGAIGRYWLNVNQELITVAGQDGKLESAKQKLRETLETEWPEKISNPAANGPSHDSA